MTSPHPDPRPAAASARPWAGRSLLILESGFLKDRRDKPVHGVELFRLLLIERLLEQGVDVTVAAERSWRRRFEERLRGARPRFIFAPNLGDTAPNALAAVALAGARRQRFESVMIGNIGRGMLPALRLARGLRLGRRVFAFAHRRPGPAAVRAVVRSGLEVVCNSDFVAERFRAALGDRAPAQIGVMYGLANAEQFHPAEPARRADGVTRFVLLARLPNVSKGHAKALAAFERLPDALRRRCELHLASFIEPTTIATPGVVTHEWIPSERAPDLLRRMDVMLCPSRNETFSQAIVQGMLTGLPVVATRIPVFTEKLGTGAGILADSEEEFGAAMERLAEDPALRATMGAEGRRVALERYVWDTERFLREWAFPGVK